MIKVKEAKSSRYSRIDDDIIMINILPCRSAYSIHFPRLIWFFVFPGFQTIYSARMYPCAFLGLQAANGDFIP